MYVCSNYIGFSDVYVRRTCVCFCECLSACMLRSHSLSVWIELRLVSNHFIIYVYLHYYFIYLFCIDVCLLMFGICIFIHSHSHSHVVVGANLQWAYFLLIWAIFATQFCPSTHHHNTHTHTYNHAFAHKQT